MVRRHCVQGKVLRMNGKLIVRFLARIGGCGALSGRRNGASYHNRSAKAAWGMKVDIFLNLRPGTGGGDAGAS